MTTSNELERMCRITPYLQTEFEMPPAMSYHFLSWAPRPCLCSFFCLS